MPADANVLTPLKSENRSARSWRALLLGRNPKRTLVRVIVLATLSIGVFGFVLVPIRVSGISMLPTYRDGSINFVNTLSYRWSAPERGDVVAIKLAGRKIMFLKRIIGRPGETVAIDRGIVKINGTPLPEPYLKLRSPWDYDEIRLGPDEFFVVGDNRSMSREEHSFGRTSARKILGKVLW